MFKAQSTKGLVSPEPSEISVSGMEKIACTHDSPSNFNPLAEKVSKPAAEHPPGQAGHADVTISAQT